MSKYINGFRVDQRENAVRICLANASSRTRFSRHRTGHVFSSVLTSGYYTLWLHIVQNALRVM
ncbi:hypothetical protein BDU57DRAFT_344740 [Ampelomyces quisqualis]|uniref:Uncharacterized protein n=1 Tax=Ampelomyces quisqualis TaxID=50730 RepID=A0A6A5QCL2_AMPQU|nr:hypothetical protein BDU57DRAFT_344740 [Ampelomyces quisqualis]